MNRARLLLSLPLAFAAAYANAGGAVVQDREISTYPFVANAERSTAIRAGYKRIALGMSPAQVAAVLGEPDEIRTLHEPKVKNGKIVGYTHWYIIRRLVKNGSAAEKQDSLVRVSFDLDDRVSKVDAWGL